MVCYDPIDVMDYRQLLDDLPFMCEADLDTRVQLPEADPSFMSLCFMEANMALTFSMLQTYNSMSCRGRGH
ncbi:MAG: hypothetical protein MZV63_32295 [Marinilabiliales bacterium]|nr:hypothetical protein [Marinilabiliales bacterium]